MNTLHAPTPYEYGNSPPAAARSSGSGDVVPTPWRSPTSH